MTTEVASLLVALAAVIVGPLVSWQIAKRQISAQVIATNRQSWIDRFRDVLAEYVRDCATLNRGYSGGALSDSEAYARYEATLLAVRRIELLINPTESDHAELIRLMKSVNEKLRKTLHHVANEETIPDGKLEEIQNLIEHIVVHGQRIFKSEWNRVKSGR